MCYSVFCEYKPSGQRVQVGAWLAQRFGAESFHFRRRSPGFGDWEPPTAPSPVSPTVQRHPIDGPSSSLGPYPPRCEEDDIPIRAANILGNYISASGRRARSTSSPLFTRPTSHPDVPLREAQSAQSASVVRLPPCATPTRASPPSPSHADSFLHRRVSTSTYTKLRARSPTQPAPRTRAFTHSTHECEHKKRTTMISPI